MVGCCSWEWIWALGALVFLMVIAMKGVNVLWWEPRRTEQHFSSQGLRGPPYRFFLGNIREMVGMMMDASSRPMAPQNPHNILPRVLSFYHQWRKKYGSTFVLWFGPTARLAIADPDLIREIFVSKADSFDRYESHPFVRLLEGEGLVSLRGEKWAHHRKVLTPTFYMDNLKLLIPHIGKTVIDMTENLFEMSASTGEVEIDVSEWYQTVTEEAITRTTFGRSYDHGKEVFKLQAKQMVYAAEAFRKVFIPGYRFLPTKRNRSCWKLYNEINKKLEKLIGHRGELSADKENSGSEAKDLLGLMIDSSTPKMQARPRPPPAITVNDIVEECKTFFFAGKQTTSNLLTWTTVLLAMHPEWQERAREEVLQICGSRDVPTRDQLAGLKSLGMILNETLRLYPPAVATIRRAKVDVNLGGYNIPRDTELLIPIMAMHHDTELWGPDATEFNPARFANGPSQAARHPNAFIPFGLGARMCIGQSLSLLTAKLTIALILQRFSFKISRSYIHAPTVLMLLYPQYGAPVIFQPLSDAQFT